MKKLTAKELSKLNDLLKRASANDQLCIGINRSPDGMNASGIIGGFQAIYDMDDYGLRPEDSDMQQNILMTEEQLKRLRAIHNRSKAKPRKLTSEQARKMAQKRHDSQ